MTNGASLSRICLLSLLLAVRAFAAGGAERPADKCFMWRVSSDTATVHLLGSVHMAKADLYPMDPAIRAAVRSARSGPLFVLIQQTVDFLHEDVDTEGFPQVVVHAHGDDFRDVLLP